MTMNDSTNPNRRRRWFQFSLRTLLVFMLVCGAGLGWLAWKMQRATRQRETVEAIVDVGGRVFYDYQLDEGGAVIPGAQPTAPLLLRKSLGGDFFCNVTIVHLGGKRVTDLKGLIDLQELYLDDAQVTDAGLVHLKGLANLEELRLDDTNVTDAGLEHLEGLTSLKGLYLYETKVTDDGVKKLQDALPDCKIESPSPSFFGTHLPD